MVIVVISLPPTEAVTLNLVTLHGKDAMCPPLEERESAIRNITTYVEAILQDLQSSCGEGLWDQVAYLNMNDPSQQCPSAWREYSESGLGIRTCRRPQSQSGSCHGTFYSTGRQYSKVCGRAIGYQIGGTDAFSSGAIRETIDSYYVYGISVTHGQPRNHIWTFASGISEGDFDQPTTVPAVIQVHQQIIIHHHSLVTTTTVSLAIQQTHSLTISSSAAIHSGMGSSVKVSVAVMENLLHGSVWSFPTQQLMLLKCAFVLVKQVVQMMLLLNYCT